MIFAELTIGGMGFLPHSGSSSPFHTPRPGWSLNASMISLRRSSFFLSPCFTPDNSFSHGAQYMPYLAAASWYCCSEAIHESFHSDFSPIGPVRKKFPPPSRISSYACLPSGALLSGGGGSVKPITNVFFPLI